MILLFEISYSNPTSYLKITADRLSYPLGLHGAEKSQWKTGILLKMDIYSVDDRFDTCKSRNFNSLRYNFYYEIVTLKKCCGYFSHPLDDRHGTSPKALRPADIVEETQAKNCKFL